MYNCPRFVRSCPRINQFHEGTNELAYTLHQKSKEFPLDNPTFYQHLLLALSNYRATSSVQLVGPTVILEVGLDCFLYSQVRNQLMLFQRLSCHRVEIAHLAKMFKDYGPLIRYTTGCDHWISKNLKGYLAAKVVRHLDFQVATA
jgi:hypothetical protein